MVDDLSDFARAVQEELNSAFSETVIDHAINPRNVGRTEGEDGFAVFTGVCGDTMMISLKIKDGRIADIRFWTDGCGTSIASGSMVTEMAKGMTVDEATQIGQAEVLEGLNGLPEESEHCALLAATALQMALREFLEKGKRAIQTDGERSARIQEDTKRDR
jgi:nitrogen fixation NifU-like protein